ncbi:MAG: heavy metal translocating P-type ATPase [bacterium]|nr:heavy metal translocating P-type ATPase [bacterium]
MRKERFDITGMTCSACSARVEKTVAGLEGVAEANVNLLTNSMNVSFDESVLSADTIVAAVEKTGYGASVHAEEQGAAKSAIKGSSQGPDPIALEMQEMKTRLLVSILFTLPLFYLAMGPMVGLPLPGFFQGPQNALAFAFTQFLLTIPVIFVNLKYYRVGFSSLLARAPNMDSLIAIGSGAAALFGIYAIYKIGAALGRGDTAMADHFAMNLYFDSTAMILTLITLGKFFEARAKGKTSDAIAKLMDLAPETATISRDGIEEVIPIQAVQVGDTLIVKAGERIPVDGEVVAGSAFVDQSALTGESIPVEKKPGDKLTSATINTSGHLQMRATRVGDDTTLAQIVRLVDEATASKAPIGRLADKISGIFVPVVIAIAVLSTATWLFLGYGVEFALSIGIAVLVISCPCALGLATPTAIMVGTGRGAAGGILFKSAEAIETAHAVDTVVLDKTGTITEGKPQLTDLAPAAGVSEKELLSLAASLEKLSEHPLGRAIVKAAEEQGLTLAEVSEFSQTAGQGINGVIDGKRIFAGNKRLLSGQGAAISESLRSQADALATDGKTVLYFLREQELLGLIAVADVLKKSSPEAVAELKAMGMQVIMLTGDNAVTAAAVQRQAGIAQVRAEVLPQDKEREIRRLQEEGRKVAMVGDGINDAPALARADVGIGIGAGTDVAIESADVVLMKSDVLDVANAIQLSRAVMRTIRQNLFWAFFYNAVGIPVAAGVFYGIWHLTLSPMLAAAAMSMSSVSVVTNALRLRFFTPKRHSASTATHKENHLEASATGATSLPEATSPSPQTRSTIMTKRIHIDGMSCGHCSASVEKALRAVAGVREVSVDLAAKMATVQVDEKVTNDTLSKAVTDSGYTVIGID